MLTGAEPIFFEGDGEYAFKIVGESYRQDVLSKLAGGRTEEGVEIEVSAMLTPDDDNPHDENAVGVFIKQHHVGYLARADAVEYRNRFGKRSAICGAVIAGGWDRGGDDVGHFGVRLDIDENWTAIL